MAALCKTPNFIIFLIEPVIFGHSLVKNIQEQRDMRATQSLILILGSLSDKVIAYHNNVAVQ